MTPPTPAQPWCKDPPGTVKLTNVAPGRPFVHVDSRTEKELLLQILAPQCLPSPPYSGGVNYIAVSIPKFNPSGVMPRFSPVHVVSVYQLAFDATPKFLPCASGGKNSGGVEVSQLLLLLLFRSCAGVLIFPKGHSELVSW